MHNTYIWRFDLIELSTVHGSAPLWTTDNFILMLIYKPKVLKWPCPIKKIETVFLFPFNDWLYTFINAYENIKTCMQTSLCLRFFFYHSNKKKGQKIANIFVRLWFYAYVDSWHTYLSWKDLKMNLEIAWWSSQSWLIVFCLRIRHVKLKIFWWVHVPFLILTYCHRY